MPHGNAEPVFQQTFTVADFPPGVLGIGVGQVQVRQRVRTDGHAQLQHLAHLLPGQHHRLGPLLVIRAGQLLAHLLADRLTRGSIMAFDQRHQPADRAPALLPVFQRQPFGLTIEVNFQNRFLGFQRQIGHLEQPERFLPVDARRSEIKRAGGFVLFQNARGRKVVRIAVIEREHHAVARQRPAVLKGIDHPIQ